MDHLTSKDLHMISQKFVSLLDSITSRVLSFVEESDYVDAYKKIFNIGAYTAKDGVQPLLAGSSKEARKMRSNFNDFVKKIVKDEIENFLREEKINNTFKEIDNLKAIHNCLPTDKTWRPPGNVDKHMKPFVLAGKLDKKDKLLRLVKAEREKLEILKTRIEGKRSKVFNTSFKIEKKVMDIRDDVLRRPEAPFQQLGA